MVDWQGSHRLLALTHLDGRNGDKLTALRAYFSEFAWMKERLEVMISYAKLHNLKIDFSLEDAQEIERVEKEIHHDVKALELFLKNRVPQKLHSHINFGLGSEDINSIALGRLLRRSREEVLLPKIIDVMHTIAEIANRQKNTSIIGYTHAVPAGLTTLGKELANPILRLCDEVEIMRSIRFQGKISGEVGTFAALSASKPKHNWIEISNQFMRSQGLDAQYASTQIVPYDSIVRFLQSIARINAILTDLTRNIWLYVLLGFVRIVKKEKEVGSAGMPHKVNPIFFEGAEGGLEMANGIIETLSRKLMTNRLQRDFSDSTVRRNIVLPLAFSLLSYGSILEGFQRFSVDKEKIDCELEAHAEVFIEPIKSMLLAGGIGDAYTLLKSQARGKTFTRREILRLIDSLKISNALKKRCIALLTQHNPYPAKIVDLAMRRMKKLL